MSESDRADDAPSTSSPDGRDDSIHTQSPSKADVFIETGLTPAEYICAAIDRAGGKLTQQAVCSFTGWSEPTVSRTLSEMEGAGAVVRFQLGTEKIVYLPEAAPDRNSFSVGSQ